VDHKSAVEHNLTERYLLGELDELVAEEFEAHFFECPLCAEDVRQASRMAANLKAVFRDDSQAQVVKLGPEDRFLDLTIHVKPAAAVCSTLECEFQCGDAAHSTIIEASPVRDCLHLLLRRDLLTPGTCVLILRDKHSRTEVERREFFVSKLS
jgi:Putative zinc-finger